MSWIQAEDTLKEHRKTYKLAGILQTTNAHAVGLLVCFWTWALAHAEKGDITDYPPLAINRAAGWEGESYIVDAFLAAGFLDKTEDGRLLIHDWDDYTGLLIDRREYDRQRKKSERKARSERLFHGDQRMSSGCPTDVQWTSNGHPSDIQWTSDGIPAVQYPTVPNPTEPIINNSLRDVTTISECPYQQIVDSFNRICVSCPKVQKLTARRKKKLSTRWHEMPDLAKWEEIFRKIEECPFLRGNNNNSWSANFDWLIDNDNNYVKVLEGQYNKNDDVNRKNRFAGIVT